MAKTDDNVVFFGLHTEHVEIDAKVSGITANSPLTCKITFKHYTGKDATAKQEERDAIAAEITDMRETSELDVFMAGEILWIKDFPLVNAHGKKVGALDTRSIPKKYFGLLGFAEDTESLTTEQATQALIEKAVLTQPIWRAEFHRCHLQVISNLSADFLKELRAKNS